MERAGKTANSQQLTAYSRQQAGVFQSEAQRDIATYVQDFRDLRVWQRSMDLAQRCYGVTDAFPSSERFGLVIQIRRSAVSIPSNIAEGRGRESSKEYVRFLRIAYGSGCELETQLLIAERLGFDRGGDLLDTAAEADEVRGMIFTLVQQLSTAR